MKLNIDNWKCKLGFHDWEVVERKKGSEIAHVGGALKARYKELADTKSFEIKVCMRCHKYEDDVLRYGRDFIVHIYRLMEKNAKREKDARIIAKRQRTILEKEIYNKRVEFTKSIRQCFRCNKDSREVPLYKIIDADENVLHINGYSGKTHTIKPKYACKDCLDNIPEKSRPYTKEEPYETKEDEIIFM